MGTISIGTLLGIQETQNLKLKAQGETKDKTAIE